MRVSKLMFALVLAALSAVAWGAESLPRQIEAAVHSGAKVVRSFPAASRLKGWVLSRDGRYTIVYTTPDGETLIAGELIDAAGRNLTEAYERKYLPRPSPGALYAELEHAPYIAEGRLAKPAAVIYALFDANCPFCHLAWKALQPYEKAGLQVRWVPVAYIKQSSFGRGAAILEAKDRLAAFRKNELGYDMRTHDGGIAPLAKPSSAALRQLQSDNDLMRRFGADGTPALVWKDRHGKVRLKVGLPRMSQLPAITGLPQQPENDPDLAQFR